ncbi:MAG: RluA family pseudouridine synthase [Nitriliruptoraceae bacterium]
MTAFTVAATEDGQRLDVVLAQRLGTSRSRAAARIDAGEVTVAGALAARRRPVRAGDEVVVTDPAPAVPTPAPPLPPVRYRDEHLVVLAKPAGLVVHPGAGHPDGTLVDALRAAGIPLAPGADPARPGIVHRLDRDTSGLLVVASTDEAAAGLITALAARAVTRRYLALVAGEPANPRGRIEAPIGRDPSDRVRFAVVGDGRPATTRYRTLATGQAAGLPPHRAVVALLACQLGTGRTHQLRVHLAALGHPIVGDPGYGAPGDLDAALQARRPVLHAGLLAFAHPVTGRHIEVTEPLPADLQRTLAAAGLETPDPTVLATGW